MLVSLYTSQLSTSIVDTGLYSYLWISKTVTKVPIKVALTSLKFERFVGKLSG